MRPKMTAAGIVLALMLTLCWFATASVTGASNAMRNLAMRAAAAVENKDYAAAQPLLNALLTTIDERRPLLEVLVSHDDINEIAVLTMEARVQLRHQQGPEFGCTMARITEALTVLSERQLFTPGNLF